MAEPTYGLALAILENLSADQANEQPEVLGAYVDLAKIVSVAQTARDKSLVTREYNLLRAKLKHQKQVSDAKLKLRGLVGKDRQAAVRASATFQSALVSSRARLDSSRSDYNNWYLEKAKAAAGTATVGSANAAAWHALFGAFDEAGMMGRLSDNKLASIIAQAEGEWGPIEKIGPAGLRGIAKRYKERAEASIATQKTAEEMLRSTEEEMLATINQLKTGKMDVKGALSAMESFGTVYDNNLEMIHGTSTPEELLEKKKQIDDEDRSLTMLKDRLSAMDEMLSEGGGMREQLRRLGSVIGNPKFRAWAHDNGYTDMELGAVPIGVDGDLNLDNYVMGKKDIRAVKLFEWQLMHPNAKRPLFGFGKAKTEWVQIVQPADAERMSKAQHRDGKWREWDGAYLLYPEMTKDLRSQYLNPEVTVVAREGVTVGAREGQVGQTYEKIYAKADDGFYVYDQAVGTWTSIAEADLPEKRVDPPVPLALLGVSGAATRYLKEEDLVSGEGSITPWTKDGDVGFGDADNSDAELLSAEWAKVKVYDRPPRDIGFIDEGRRGPMHAIDVRDNKLGRVRVFGRDGLTIHPPGTTYYVVGEGYHVGVPDMFRVAAGAVASGRVNRITKDVELNPTLGIRTDKNGSTAIDLTGQVDAAREALRGQRRWIDVDIAKELIPKEPEAKEPEAEEPEAEAPPLSEDEQGYVAAHNREYELLLDLAGPGTFNMHWYDKELKESRDEQRKFQESIVASWEEDHPRDPETDPEEMYWGPEPGVPMAGTTKAARLGAQAHLDELVRDSQPAQEYKQLKEQEERQERQEQQQAGQQAGRQGRRTARKEQRTARKEQRTERKERRKEQRMERETQKATKKIEALQDRWEQWQRGDEAARLPGATSQVMETTDDPLADLAQQFGRPAPVPGMTFKPKTSPKSKVDDPEEDDEDKIVGVAPTDESPTASDLPIGAGEFVPTRTDAEIAKWKNA